MKKVFLFSGTREGRFLASWLAENKIQCIVSVATEYGRLVMEENPFVRILEGRMNQSRMVEQFQKECPVCVVDATHPFATRVTEEIQAACVMTKIPYYRVSRELDVLEEHLGKQDAGSRVSNQESTHLVENARFFSTMEEAARYLRNKEGNIFLTTGSKQLGDFVKICQDTDRIFARVLPSMESLALCEKAGLTGKHVIAMQGPFSKEMNVEMIKQVQASYMVTKETGLVGGFPEKIEAAGECGCEAIILENPEKKKKDVLKYTVAQIQEELYNVLEICNVREMCDAPEMCDTVEEKDMQESVSVPEDPNPEILLVGIGMGAEDTMTIAGDKALKQCDILFGAPRLLQDIQRYGKPMVPLYKRDEILSYLKQHPGYRRVVVALSGDTGFYSGAAAFCRDFAEKEKDWNIKILPGISSVSYFASKLQKSWQNWTLLSAHGRFCDICEQVRQKQSCYVLMEDVASVKKLGETLQEEFGETVRVSYGYQLSYPEEVVCTGSPKMLQEIPDEQKGLYVVFIEHENES